MKKININNFLFLSSWIIFLFYILLFNESELGYAIDNSIIKPMIFGIVLFISIIKIIVCNKYKLNNLIFIIALTVFMIIVSHLSNNYNLLLFEMLIIASKNVEFRKIVKIDMIIRIICIAILFLLCREGFINNYTATINGSLKQAYGWLHPNTFGAISSIVILEYLYLNWNKLTVLKAGFAATLIIIVFFISASRTNVYLITFTLFFSYFMKHFKFLRENRVINEICVYIYPIMAVVSFLLVFLYNKGYSIGVFLNDLTTGRLYLANLFYKEYGISMLGQPLKIITTRQALKYGLTPAVLDMAYMRLIIQYGVIYFIVFIVLNTLTQKKIIKQKKYPELMLMIFFAIIGLAENTVLYLYMNIGLFLIIQAREKSGENGE